MSPSTTVNTMSFLTALVLTTLVSTTLRGTCDYIQVNPGNGCWKLAQRCGTSQAKLKGFNKPNLCNTLKADQYVCCFEGSLPDFSPKPNADGSCHAYAVNDDDTCAKIAEASQMKAENIPKFNGDTWGWAGCRRIQVGQKICLSEGTPPFPAPMQNAICGPQVGCLSQRMEQSS